MNEPTREDLEKAVITMFKMMPRKEWDRIALPSDESQAVKQTVRAVMTKHFPTFDDTQLGVMRK